MDKEKKGQENTKSDGTALNTLDTEELGMFEDLNLSESADKKQQEDPLPPPDEKEIKPDDSPEKFLAEDDLWDSGGKVDNVPLFEEFASELLEHDEKKGGQSPETETQPEIQLDNLTMNVPFEAGNETETSGPPTEESDSAQADGETKEEAREDAREEIKRIDIGTENPRFLWGLITLALILIVTGGMAVWKMTGPILNPSIKSAIPQDKKDKVTPGENAKSSQLSGNNKSGSAARQPGESQKTPNFAKIALAPFLIPAQQNGEMVFFNLQVELLARDQKTMDALTQKEVWIRDIIYKELKNIDISKGMQGNLLAQYQKPIVDHINTELAPLRVEDARLSGSLIK